VKWFFNACRLMQLLSRTLSVWYYSLYEQWAHFLLLATEGKNERYFSAIIVWIFLFELMCFGGIKYHICSLNIEHTLSVMNVVWINRSVQLHHYVHVIWICIKAWPVLIVKYHGLYLGLYHHIKYEICAMFM
jgi:hypothetical protein